MAGVSQLNYFPCNTFSPSSPMLPVSSKASILTIGLTERSSWSAGRSKVSSGGAMKRSAVLRVRAAGSDYVSGTDTGGAGAPVMEADKPEEPSEIARLKKALVDSFYGTNRGLSASAETRAEIMELITQLDARNPTPAPTEALTLLNGKWILAHTYSLGLFPVLLSGMLPLVNVEEISQIIDSVNFSIQNSIKFSGPLGSTSIHANAKFEIQSPQRVQVKFEELIIGTPQVADSLVLPESVEFLGQKINLAQFRGVLAPVRDTARTISSRPPLKLSLPSTTGAESWLLMTYLDEDLRISWGDGGNVFVFLKENSLLLSP